jgi:selenocysteine lyase/cysteine desulfurase
VVDGIQGAGTFLPGLRDVGAFACSGHKGLLAPQGQGFLWTDPEFRRLLAPTGSWLAVEGGAGTDWSQPLVEDGRRLEPGAPRVMACAGLLEALRTLQVPGIPAISAHVRKLQGGLLDRLADHRAWSGEALRLRGLLEADRIGPFLAFHHGGRGADGLGALLRQGNRRGIYASAREGYLRVAFHGWHEEGDLNRVGDWLGD